MDLYSFFLNIQNSGIAQWVNTFGATYPVVESLHVLAVALVFGSIMVVDLRLLGVASVNRPFTRVGMDLLKLTWLGFALAVVTGILLFLPNASSIYQNPNFQIKMLLILLAGVNMAIMEGVVGRDIATWDTAVKPPTAARICGFLSLTFWAGVIIFGRLIGFTTVTDDPFAGLL
jgi:hypothetical protein